MFCMSIDNDLFHRGIENRHFPFLLFLACVLFFLSLHILRQRYPHNYINRKFIFGIQNNNDKVYRGIDDQLCPFCFSLYLLCFFSPCNQYCNFPL